VATQSESHFERFCEANHVPCERIPVSTARTPDYVIELDARSVVCEIKQLDLGNRERHAWMEVAEGRASAYFVQNRLREKLKSVSGQLKDASSGGTPTVLVVFDNTPSGSELNDSKVVQALYGRIRYPILLSDDSEPVLGDPRFGGNQAFTPTQNTAVSALAVLEELDGNLRLRVYHNLHAAVPLNPDLFANLPVEQKVLPGDTSIEVDA
jgi:hypothetical protein